MNEQQQHGDGHGGPLDELREVLAFFRKHRPHLEIIIPFAAKTIQKIEANGGIVVNAFGRDLFKVKL